MKRLITILITFLYITAAYGESFDVDGYGFKIISNSERTVCLVRDNEERKLDDGRIAVVIPSSVTYQGIDYTVVEIGKNVSVASMANIITLPNTIKRVCDEAYMYCAFLEEINLPEGLESIGSRAFGSSKVKEIHIPASVRHMGSAPFIWADSTKITVDESNPYYDSREGCNAIIETETNKLIQGSAYTRIPESVTSIGVNAFGAQYGLRRMEIPSSVRVIRDSAFMWCNSLQEVRLHEGLQSIGDKAFMMCHKLEGLAIPKSVEHIGINGIFANSDMKLSVEEGNPFYDSREDCNAVIASQNDSLVQGSNLSRIPPSVKIIGDLSFGGCLDITSLRLPEGLTTIGNEAFSACYNLAELSLPSTLVRIGSRGFYYCAFSEITLSEGLESIGSYAFQFCRNLKQVRFPQTVKSIGEAVFDRCVALDSITVLATTPPEVATGQPMLPEEKYATTVLTVPEGCEEAYRKHEVWGRFKNIVERDLTAIHSPSAATKQQKVPYDLSGRHLSARPTKGLYIEDGKVRVASTNN